MRIDSNKYSSFTNCPIEVTFLSDKHYSDPFNEVELDVVFQEPNGNTINVPAFWAGNNKWVVRYASYIIGCHKFKTKCTDKSNNDLNNIKGIINISKYSGSNVLFTHGPLRISNNGRYLEHIDGTPFFWLGDTWWHGFVKRLKWPEDFKLLVRDRVKKGFSVIQIVAGLYYDTKSFNEFGANEAGWAWNKDFTCINPSYFDYADQRIKYLIENGIVPCIVGAWGFHLYFQGLKKMKKHWRYLVARWGSYPVVWCVAGEAKMPYFYDNSPEKELK